MKMRAFSFDHPEQRIELASNRDRFRIQKQGLGPSMHGMGCADKWTLKQVQGDDI
jgi:hypothetical protein